MTTWSTKLYMDKTVRKHPHRYQKRFEKRGNKRGFCVALSAKPENSLEIYSARTPWYWYQQERGIHIVGLSVSYQGAVQLVSQIVLDVQQENDTVSSEKIREYFNGNRR